MAGQFSIDLSRIIKKAKGNTDLAVRKVMLEAFTGVVRMSPVDTGRFRGNWMVGYGSPSAERGTEDRSGGATTARIVSEITTAKLGISSIFLTNNLPYAIELENGSSTQAPSGMVGVTLARINAKYGA